MHSTRQTVIKFLQCRSTLTGSTTLTQTTNQNRRNKRSKRPKYLSRPPNSDIDFHDCAKTTDRKQISTDYIHL